MTGKEMYELACTKIGQRYQFGTLVPKNDRGWSKAWDCAEFTSWAVFQATGKLYGCNNNAGNPENADSYSGFWSRDAERIGKKISIDEAASTPGAFLVRSPAHGMIGHVAISDGKGGTVEAHSTKTGVIKNIVHGRRWDYGVLPPGIDYSKEIVPVQTVPPVAKIYRYVTPIVFSEMVRKIQWFLKGAGYKIEADGKFGPKTFEAVKLFQARVGLVADGEVGSLTLEAMGL